MNCDGRLLKVPTNLFLALRRFRRRSESRTLWADSICIDQANTTEKGHHVNFMGEISRGAEIVLSWLGNDHPRIARNVFNFMRVCCDDILSQVDQMQANLARYIFK